MLNNLYVVGHESKSTFVMCERIISGTRSFVRCHNKACGMRESMTKNIDKIVDLKPLLKKICIHAKVCSILSLPEGSDRTNEEEHFIEVQTNTLSPLKAEKLEAKAEKSKNDMDPSDKIGKAANVFNIKINNPPSKSEQEEINKKLDSEVHFLSYGME